MKNNFWATRSVEEWTTRTGNADVLSHYQGSEECQFLMLGISGALATIYDLDKK
jgi:hypothetical protein